MPARLNHVDAVRRTGIMTILAAFDPHLAGTPPLGLALPASDIDVLCHAPDPLAFTAAVWTAYGDAPAFSIRQWIGGERAVIATFDAEGWTFELFASSRPVAEQAGWRHFIVEQRLLRLGGAGFRTRVMAHRWAGLKTEPAFAAALGLKGDPYRLLLDLAHETEEQLREQLARAGYGAPGGRA
ncbi:DUF4269 domain-containing protein (plasmid) [Azospirillum brasilense]|uniref:DUF4269 domain-containing protein n=1 Tax=Azospirillum brasilense TaxID=192 RepID=A0A4D8RA43_AZOBR|nr:DUF4269 domain-containing protein [Azospirillum brasilense]QCO19848.1 DUF4269 domain-containing protein [Azospirillum brasilense]